MIQRGSDITALSVSDLGFYSFEQHLLNITVFKGKFGKPDPYTLNVLFFCAQTHALPMLQRQFHELRELCALQGQLGLISSEGSTESWPTTMGVLVAVNNALHLITRSEDGCLMVSFSFTSHLGFACYRTTL